MSPIVKYMPLHRNWVISLTDNVLGLTPKYFVENTMRQLVTTLCANTGVNVRSTTLITPIVSAQRATLAGGANTPRQVKAQSGLEAGWGRKWAQSLHYLLLLVLCLPSFWFALLFAVCSVSKEETQLRSQNRRKISRMPLWIFSVLCASIFDAII